MTTYTDPFRLRVQKALAELLETITTDNGYQFDLAGKVFRGRNVFGDTDPKEMLAVLEDPEMKNILPVAEGNVVAYDYQLLVQGWTRDDKTHPTDRAQHLLAAAKRRLGLEIRRVEDGRVDFLGVYGVASMTLGIGVVRPADDLSASAYFWLPLTLRVAEDISDPYGEVAD